MGINRVLSWLGCHKRARNNELRVFAFRVEHAETAAERLRIVDDALEAGVLSEVEAMMDARPLVTHEAIALRLYRGYWEEVA